MLSVAMLAAALSSPSLAQEEGERPLASLKPVLAGLGMLIDRYESDGYQITDMSVGLVFEETEGTSVPVMMVEDAPMQLVALGDPERLSDLNLTVFDPAGGEVASDLLDDNMPVVRFLAPNTGTYDARMTAASGTERYHGGFFAFVAGHVSERAVVSVTRTFAAMWATVELLERDGYQVLHGEWRTLERGGRSVLRVSIPPRAESCRAVAVGSDDRTRQLDMVVRDPIGVEVDRDRAHGELALGFFEPTIPGEYSFELHARRLRARVAESPAALVLACTGL